MIKDRLVAEFLQAQSLPDSERLAGIGLVLQKYKDVEFESEDDPLHPTLAWHLNLRDIEANVFAVRRGFLDLPNEQKELLKEIEEELNDLGEDDIEMGHPKHLTVMMSWR
jgi:hypothetical protein